MSAIVRAKLSRNTAALVLCITGSDNNHRSDRTYHEGLPALRIQTHLIKKIKGTNVLPLMPVIAIRSFEFLIVVFFPSRNASSPSISESLGLQGQEFHLPKM